MRVVLEIPDEIGFQLVYRQERRSPVELGVRDDVDFRFLRGAMAGMGAFGLLAANMGRIGAMKAIAKLATGRRSFYLVTKTGQVVSTGWCTTGRCKHYQVERRAVVIGPIWSSPEVRGQGIATYALQAAMNQLVSRGASLFYIDTFKTNTSSQRVIEKSGFGGPIAVYSRLAERDRGL
jgi:hypothetical protein